MVAALRFRVNEDYDAYLYPVGTYNKIDWENELPCQLGTDYSVYLLWSSFFVTLRPNFHYRSYTLP